MGYMKLSLCLMLITLMTFTAARRHGQKLQFHDSGESGEIDDIDLRPGNGRRIRNHRGRGGGHHGQYGNSDSNFEQGIPDAYPIRGPAQAPLVLPTHPGNAYGLQKQHKITFPSDNGGQFENNNNNQQSSSQPNNFNRSPAINGLQGTATTAFQEPPLRPQDQLIQRPVTAQTTDNRYSGNPFLTNKQTPPAPPPTNKQNPLVIQPVTNELPTADTLQTTTPSYANPRRTDLFFGSNLLEEEKAREGKSTDDISFPGRGLFDSAPHCQAGYILVNNKCRLAV